MNEMLHQGLTIKNGMKLMRRLRLVYDQQVRHLYTTLLNHSGPSQRQVGNIVLQAITSVLIEWMHVN